MISGKIGNRLIAQDDLSSLFSDSKNYQQPEQFSGQYQHQGSFNQNKNPNNFEYQQPSTQRRDPLQFIQLRYTNPLKPQVNQDGVISADVVQMYNNIQIPVISNLEKLLQNCETMKDNYNSLLSISQVLKNAEKSKPNPTEKNFNSSGPWDRVSSTDVSTKSKDSSLNNSSLNNSNNPFSNALNSGYGGTKSNGYPSQNSGYPSQNSGYPSQNPGYTSQNSLYSSQYSSYPSSMKISSAVREQDVNNFITKFQCTRATAIGYLETFGSFEQACKEYQNNN